MINKLSLQILFHILFTTNCIENLQTNFYLLTKYFENICDSVSASCQHAHAYLKCHHGGQQTRKDSCCPQKGINTDICFIDKYQWPPKPPHDNLIDIWPSFYMTNRFWYRCFVVTFFRFKLQS